MSGAPLVLAAPAKINLFLHVTGRRADGYHLLESVFALLDLADTVTLVARADGAIARTHDVDGVPEDVDLAVRAARNARSSSTGTPGTSPVRTTAPSSRASSVSVSARSTSVNSDSSVS